MNVSTQIESDFLFIFHTEIDRFKIDDCDTELNLHILRIENNRLSYHQLEDQLTEALVTYALSRNELAELEGKRGLPYKRAKKRFRDHSVNDGELGEMLLYCFLETHLGAPKIFTKLELKTARNDYVKGADGVHFLKVSDDDFLLIFGESKMEKGLTTSISNAFKSINEFVTRRDDNIHDETKLVQSHLIKEAATNAEYEFIKSLLIPTADSVITKANAFAIFAGFDLDVTKEELKLKPKDFQSTIHAKIREEVEKRIPFIKKKVEQYQLYGYRFFLYACPFTDIAKVRKDLIDKM